MGEVFRARDTRLNRDVAVKVLPKDFAADPARLRRFEREAKTLAALNHPNVLTIFDTGVHEGVSYLKKLAEERFGDFNVASAALTRHSPCRRLGRAFVQTVEPPAHQLATLRAEGKSRNFKNPVGW